MSRHQVARRRSIASDLPTLAAAPLSGRSIVVKVVNDGAIPTTVPKYFACVPVTPSGVETEGGSRTLTDGSGRVYVCVLGPAVPMAGTYLLASEVGGRWAACYPDQGGGGITLPGCPCIDIPSDLTMTSSDTSGNGGLFQNATFTYQAVPAGLLPLGIGPSAFLSNETFPDYPGAPDVYRYYFFCGAASLYSLARVFETSVYGSPYMDTVIYRWLIGIGGNTCDPFSLVDGQVFSGGSPVDVEITG